MTEDRSVQIAADRLAEAFEAGIAPWSRPARMGFACGLPVNARTGRSYTGMLAWLLEIAAIERGYRSRYWGTTEDWSTLGGTILRDDGDTLFNADQVRIRLAEDPRNPDYDRARRLVTATGARIRWDVRPSPLGGVILYTHDGLLESSQWRHV
jgi:antirestriction protein ArdC